MPDFIEDYDDKTVPEVTSILDTLGAVELEQLYEYETENKGRTTLLDDIEQEIDAHAGGNDEPADDGDAVRVEEPSTDGTTDVSTVRVRIPRRGQYAGTWFDSATTTTLTRTPRVEEELQRGRISEIGGGEDE